MNLLIRMVFSLFVFIYVRLLYSNEYPSERGVMLTMDSKIEQLALKSGVQTLLVASPSSVKYFTGIGFETYERPVILFYHDGEVMIIVPKLEKERIKGFHGSAIYYEDGEDPWHLAKFFLEDAVSNTKKLGVEYNLPHNIFSFITASISRDRIIDISSHIAELRAIKSSDETKLIRKAADIIENIYIWIENNLTIGMSERDASLEIIGLGEKLGADNVIFAAVQSGPNSSIPHHERSSRIIVSNEVLVVDIALSYQGYYADLTRVFFTGNPMDSVVEKYKLLEKMVSKVVETGGEGTPASKLDGIVRRELKKRGLLDYFVHRTGHGLGVDVHEPPYISPNSKDFLRSGMVFTIEPGLYFRNKYGLRLETDVLVSGEDLIPLDSGKWSMRILSK
jgi:Xaa-Pro dipeptidase